MSLGDGLTMLEEFKCPVCCARQQLQPECRRCRADLRLLMQALFALRDAQQQLQLALAEDPSSPIANLVRERLEWLSPTVAARFSTSE